MKDDSSDQMTFFHISVDSASGLYTTELSNVHSSLQSWVYVLEHYYNVLLYVAGKLFSLIQSDHAMH